MPLETIVVAFVALAFVAIAWRFLPGPTEGSGRFRTVIDESVGMWLVRRALGRPADRPGSADDIAIPEPDVDEIAFRIGVADAPPPTLPTRLVVSKAPSTRRSAFLAHAATVHPPSVGFHGGANRQRRSARPSGALAAQRRSAGAVALAVVAIAVTTLALGARRFDGGVLSATGTPAGLVAVPSPSAEPSFAPSATP
jgi:hypothetical protein